MAVCRTSLIMGALTVSIFLNDVWRGNVEDVPIHIFLGLLVTMLFYGLCGYGYEMVNWVSLGIIAFVLVFSGISFATKSAKSCSVCGQMVQSCGCRRPVDECNVCRKPAPVCGCKKSKYDVDPPRISLSKATLNCPANPVTLNTACGISRYN